MGFDLNRAIRGRVWKFGDSVDTDSINPFYLYHTMEELKKHTLESFRPEFPKEVKPGDIIVAGRNFGCGSHRPGLVLREVGVAAIVVESASRLFLRNTIALPMPIFIAPGISQLVDDGETLELDYQAGVARNTATGAAVAIPKFPPMIEQIYACGGLPRLARQRYLAETRTGG
ncbi:MAG: 3-isopropylmalate dehydratase small subunit [Betaproteobacteria bacterium]|nr:3-isopropylmalate dehydratase small subunit [Betaproteobacteria bacterium]